jgi:hypothetical protein
MQHSSVIDEAFNTRRVRAAASAKALKAILT